MSDRKRKALRQTFYQNLLDLSHEDGINASGKEDVFGCIFGRDSAITVLKILRVHTQRPSLELLKIARRTLLALASLQGREFNRESGEELGKFIHEFRKERFEHLTKSDPPWYIYPDGYLRNYDSIDCTPLTLIAIYKYWEITQDNEFLVSILQAVENGLNWIITFGDSDKDLFLEYKFDPKRKFGGLSVQSWTDSKEALLDINGQMPKYPIAPVEAQGFAWLALMLWSDFYLRESPTFGKKILLRSKKIKTRFNEKFIINDHGFYFAVQALDGDKNQIKTITANPLLLLWAVYKKGSRIECILDKKYISDFVKRGFLPDLFVEDAGIRTMSSDSKTFNPNRDSYHNGSFWPMLNGLIIEGLLNFGFNEQVKKLREASIKPLLHFKTPIELYIKSGNDYLAYLSPSGQTSCRVQAWSAAAALDYL